MLQRTAAAEPADSSATPVHLNYSVGSCCCPVPRPDGPCRDSGCHGASGRSRQFAAIGVSWEATGVATELDLARLLIPDPRRSLLVRVCGESMRDAGIRHGALLVVERRRRAANGAIVVARLGERFTLKRLQWRRGRCWLEPAHPAYPALDLERLARQQGLSGAEVQIWGVALHAIHSL